MFSRYSGRVHAKNRRIRARSNSVNDSDNCVQQCCARDIIAYCVQFANGSRCTGWLLAPFYTFIPATVTPLLTQFVTTTDDGLPRLCSGRMIHRYRCVRHDLSRLTITRPLNSFGCYLMIFLLATILAYITCGKTYNNTEIAQMHFYIFDNTAFDDDILIKYELLNRMNK